MNQQRKLILYFSYIHIIYKRMFYMNETYIVKRGDTFFMGNNEY